MDYASLERELYVDAAPDVVFDVVSRPEHVKRWWPDDASYDLTPGAPGGEIVFGECGAGGSAVPFVVVAVSPPRSFSFRWTHPAGEAAGEENSFLVTFDLTPSGSGTMLRMTETGFRERGWDEAEVAAQYADHVAGWDTFLPRIAPYVATLQVTS